MMDTKAKVLVVDDDPISMHLLTAVLVQDYQVISAFSGQQALALLSHEQPLPDLVLLDVIMPEMDGYRVCTALKENVLWQAIPVIFVTGQHSDADQSLGFATGAVDYIAKPVNAPVVQARVRTHIQLYRARQLLEQQNRELKKLATCDALTGLANRNLLTHFLEECLHQRQRDFAVAFLDLDKFKEINDHFGHAAGDAVLKIMAKRLSCFVGTNGLVARLGGDEFVMVIEGTKSVLQQSFNRVLVQIEEPIFYDGHLLKLSGSMGVAFYPGASDAAILEADQIIRQADQAMYAAKVQGRNCISEFSQQQENLEKSRYNLYVDIAKAIDNSEFTLHYQPKVHLRTGEVLGVEALIRWNHLTQGVVMPGEFLLHIRNHPLEIKVGQWVIEKAIRQIDGWQREGHCIKISVNMAGYHLQDIGFVDYLKATLAKYPLVSPELLELEVLETTVIEDMQQVNKVIYECRQLGIIVSLDDFGTGYSTLSHLKDISADILKIDRSFVRDMLVDEGDLAILTGVIGFAKAFKRRVIAEGVESLAVVKKLLELGCDWGQGYYIAKPMPETQVLDWLTYWQRDGFQQRLQH